MVLRLLKIAAGGLWFFLCMILGVKLFFPAQAVADRVSFEVDRSTNGGIQLVLGDVGAWTFSGLSAEDVQILRNKRPNRRGGDQEEESTASLLAQFETLRARVQLGSLFGGDPRFSVEGEAYDGRFDAQVGIHQLQPQAR